MRMGTFGNEKGVALLVVITFATVIALIAAYVLRFSYNQARQVDAVSIRHTMINYRAQAGVIDAFWRIRTNPIPPIPGAPAGSSFTTATYDPPPYFIDIDTDTVTAGQDAASDVRIDIGSMNATGDAIGLRPVVSTGLDV